MNESYNKKICWIWLTLSLGVCSPKIWKLVNEHHTIEETCRYVQSNDVKKKVVDIKIAKQVLVDCIRDGIKIVCYSDSEYPKSLKDIENPPTVLFYKGDLNILSHDRLLTVVGTRKPVDYTIKLTSIICDNLVKEGFILISGFAVGVDSIAHKSALDYHRPTVSVLACGLDYDYPKGTSHVKDSIILNGGLVLTEQFPKTPPYRGNFPKRNRILAGLGNGTLVTEASIHSGALITADYTRTMGKPLFCVPPTDVFDERFLGLLKYIRDGAICVSTHNDILYEYVGSYPSNVRNTNIIQINHGEEVSKSPIFKNEFENIKKDVENKFKGAYERDGSSLFSNDKVEGSFNGSASPSKETYGKVSGKVSSPLSEKELLVIQSIKKGYNYLDDIANDTNIEISDLFEIVSDLEVAGIVRSEFGNKYTLVSD